MPIELTLHGADAEAIRSQIAGLMAIFGQPQETTDVHVLPPASGREPIVRPVASKKDSVAKRPAPEQIDLEEAIADAKDTPVPVTKDTLRAKLIELMNLKGEEAPSCMLREKFNVSKISELDASHYDACFAAAQKLIAGEG